MIIIYLAVINCQKDDSLRKENKISICIKNLSSFYHDWANKLVESCTAFVANAILWWKKMQMLYCWYILWLIMVIHTTCTIQTYKHVIVTWKHCKLSSHFKGLVLKPELFIWLGSVTNKKFVYMRCTISLIVLTWTCRYCPDSE